MQMQSSEFDKARHFLSLLLSLGRPTPPLHLALRTTLFPATPQLIISLCEFPNSPIALIHDVTPLVTISLFGFFSIANFASRSGVFHGLVGSIPRKRKRGWGWDNTDEDGSSRLICVLPKRVKKVDAFAKDWFQVNEAIGRSVNSMPSYMLNKFNNMFPTHGVIFKMNDGKFFCKLKNTKISGEKEYLAQCSKVENTSEQINTTAFGLRLLEGSDSNRPNKIESLEEQLILPEGSDCKRNNQIALVQKPIHAHVNKQAAFSITGKSVAQQQSSKPYAKVKEPFEDDVDSSKQVPDTPEREKASVSLKRNKQVEGDLMAVFDEQKAKLTCDKMQVEEKNTGAETNPPKDQVESKNLPNFESYVVEEEEGSGGYGVVYRARKKIDGTAVAIKCPYADAHRHHVTNELKMLERFGGKNFIIKFEGRIRNGNSDCFILEHVEHDRPEVLKKEIDIFQLRWYGYCLFKALASLHKQEVVHRDVKPGNFLFSRKTSKGYLIDFNLAMDLHQKYGTSKLKPVNEVGFNHVTLPSNKSIPPIKSRRIPSAKSLETLDQEATKRVKSKLEPKNLKKRPSERAKVHKDLVGFNIMKNQGAEGSGVTSLKDATSTRTPSAERLREPLPCQGRKELISLLQEAMHGPNHEASSVPAPMRKRVAAPPRRVDGKLIYISPMPLHTAGIGVTSAAKVDGKQKKEGPCVGTKGFRAPEVLFRSIHQGPKVDVWSAGVTLLYLIIGRSPFYGDPEQNIKDIAKLRGCEDLWELSKLHDQESQFPVGLYNTRHLPPLSLMEWCKLNTKRRDFLNSIPASLVDLVDRCLTVNPRSRISADEALRHEFFASCHEGIKKQRLLRQDVRLDSANSLPGRNIS